MKRKKCLENRYAEQGKHENIISLLGKQQQTNKFAKRKTAK